MDSDKERDIRRVVTTSALIPPLNKNDERSFKVGSQEVTGKSGGIGGRIYRSKSSSMPGLSYVDSTISSTGLEEQNDKEINIESNKGSQVLESSVFGPPFDSSFHPSSSPKNLNSGKTDSVFNGTLILTASPTQAYRHPTVIRRAKSKLESPTSFDTLDSNNFQVSDAYRIQAISPMSEDLAAGITQGSGIDKAMIGTEKDDNDSQALHGKAEPEELFSVPSGVSILEPLRGNQMKKTNSVFREQHSGMVPNTANDETYKYDSQHEMPFSDPDPFDDEDQIEMKSISLVKSNSQILRRGWVYIIILAVLLSVAICGYVPTIFFLIKGTKSLVLNYFSSLNPNLRDELFNTLDSKFHVNKPRQVDHDDNFNLLQNHNNSEIIFKGISYSPLNSMEPQCGSSPKDIELDLKVLSQVTTRVRNYGMQCNQSEYILDAIGKLGLNMSLTMGVWIGSNDTINNQQLDLMKQMLQKYPRNLFHSVLIGNEVLFREDKSEQELIDIIKDVKSFTRGMGYNDLPIGTSEIGSLITEELLDACDLIGANIHPFFGGVDVTMATNWTYEFLKYQIEPLNKRTNTPILITEVGWPYAGGKYKGSIANSTNFQRFLSDWICGSSMNNNDSYEWYYFEAFDEPWKAVFFEGNNKWETEWGIFDQNRNMKPYVKFPTCLN